MQLKTFCARTGVFVDSFTCYCIQNYRFWRGDSTLFSTLDNSIIDKSAEQWFSTWNRPWEIAFSPTKNTSFKCSFFGDWNFVNVTKWFTGGFVDELCFSWSSLVLLVPLQNVLVVRLHLNRMCEVFFGHSASNGSFIWRGEQKNNVLRDFGSYCMCIRSKMAYHRLLLRSYVFAFNEFHLRRWQTIFGDGVPIDINILQWINCFPNIARTRAIYFRGSFSHCFCLRSAINAQQKYVDDLYFISQNSYENIDTLAKDAKGYLHSIELEVATDVFRKNVSERNRFYSHFLGESFVASTRSVFSSIFSTLHFFRIDQIYRMSRVIAFFVKV